jgi:hypothetical protein
VVTMKNAVCGYQLTPVPHLWIFLSGRWRQYVPPKRRFTQDLHGATSQKMAFFITYTIILVQSFITVGEIMTYYIFKIKKKQLVQN